MRGSIFPGRQAEGEGRETAGDVIVLNHGADDFLRAHQNHQRSGPGQRQ